MSRLVRVISFTFMVLLTNISLSYGLGFFDTAGQSARPMGMGEVFLASTSNSSDYWYNPAGLSLCQKSQIGFSYSNLYPSVISDLTRYQLTYVNPLGEKNGFGLGVTYLGIDSAKEMVFSAAYGLSLFEHFSLGGNVKVLYWSIKGEEDLYSGGKDDDLSKVSFSLDLSAMHRCGKRFGLDDVAAGIYVKDALMPNISESGDEGGKLPVEIGLGIMGQKGNVIGEGDVAFVNGETIFRCGAESGVTGSNLKVRGGFIYGSDFEDDVERTDFTLGLGYSFSSLVFDYAYNYPLAFIDTGGRHFITFGVSY